VDCQGQSNMKVTFLEKKRVFGAKGEDASSKKGTQEKRLCSKTTDQAGGTFLPKKKKWRKQGAAMVERGMLKKKFCRWGKTY